MRKYLCFVAVICNIAFYGCTTRLTDFTIASTKTIELSKVPTFKRGGQRTTGKDTAHIIIFIPLGQPNIKEAIDRAIEKIPGAVALLDGVISIRNFYIPYVYGQNSYIVEGTALIDPALLAKNSDKNSSEYMISHHDPQTNEPIVSEVSEDEYKKMKFAVESTNGYIINDNQEKMSLEEFQHKLNL